MATPTIIIGIGTSGLYTLENAQRFYYETHGKNKPDNVEYIYIETNAHNLPVGTPAGKEDIKRVYVSLDDMAAMIEEIQKTCNNPSWLPETKSVLSAGLGAAGIRGCGRLALWGRNKQGDNFEKVTSAIERAFNNVKHISNVGSSKSEKPVVIITGSLTGGTGSGMFIDMGYFVRKFIPDIKYLYGLFLLPKEPKITRGYEVMYGNTYGAIKDLEFFNNENNPYSQKWPGGQTENFKGAPPFEIAQFISQDYQDGNPAIENLNGLYKMAGLYLFLNISGIIEKRHERILDGKGNSQIGNYGTFGLSAIQFPKDQIQEFVSAELSIEMLSRLIDSKDFYLNGQKRQINRATIKQSMAIVFDGILENAFANLNTVEGKDLLVSLDKDATQINKGEIKGSPVEFIISMFTSTRNDNYHALVNNNIKSALNVFVDSIYQQVDTALQSTENLYYAKYVLEDIVESIERTLNYWKSIGLSSQSQNWDNELRKLAIGCTKNTYKSVFEHDAVLKDRLNTIMELMKMHLCIKSLIDISKHVKEGAIRLEGSNHELPKLSLLDNLIRKIKTVIGKNDDATNSSNINFDRRMNDILGDINDKTLPILRVYPSNSFTEECSKAKQTYEQRNGGGVRSIKEVIEQQNVFNYLKKKLSGNFNDEIYLEFLNGYRNRANDCIEDYDVVTYVKDKPNETVEIAHRATSPFLKINKVLGKHPNLPRFIVGSDKNDIVTAIQTMLAKNFDEFENKADNIKEIQELKNILVFYDEKGNFTLKDHLTYMDRMKEAFENVPSDLADPNVTKDRWIKNRSAYTTN